jgi:hypothetical protein
MLILSLGYSCGILQVIQTVTVYQDVDFSFNTVSRSGKIWEHDKSKCDLCHG